MNNIKKLCLILLFTCIASFSLTADTTAKAISQSPTSNVVSKDESSKQQLKKQVSVHKNSPTTWTKIKDLFE
jgi:hypothetical protein